MRGTPRQAALAVLLAAVAGFVDAACYIVLNGLFVAHITGDTDRFGQRLGRGLLDAAAPIGLVVLEWTAAIALATIVLEAARRTRFRAPVSAALAVEAALVAALMAWRGAGFYGREALAACALGIQTAAVTKWGRQTIRTTYLSGMLTRFAQSVAALVLARGDRRHARVMASVYLLLWLGFAAGGAGGAWATLRWSLWSLALPLGGLVLATVLELG